MSGRSVFRLLAVPGAALAFCAGATPAGAQFMQCPAVGVDTSCQFLITVTDQGSTVQNDPSQRAYEASEDSLVGVQNSSSKPIAQLPLSSTTGIFGFEGDGICDNGSGPVPPGCQPVPGTPPGTQCTSQGLLCSFPPPSGEPAGYVEPGADGAPPWPNGSKQNGYEGPTSWFSNVANGGNTGTVNFSPPIQPGQSTYFSLEEPPSTPGGLQAGTPTPPPNSTPPPTTTAGNGQLPPGTTGTKALPLPSAKRCTSRRAFPIKVRKYAGVKWDFAVVSVNNKRVPVYVYAEKRRRVSRIGQIYLNSTRRFRAFVDLRGLARGTYSVRVSAITVAGQIVNNTRRYRTCTRKLGGTIPRL